MLRPLLTAVLVVTCAVALHVAAAPVRGVSDQPPTADQIRRLIVRWSDRAGCAASSSAADERLVSRLGALGFAARAQTMPRHDVHHLMDLGRDVSADEAALAVSMLVAAESCVDYADPDGVVRLDATVNDPYFATYGNQWYLWEATAGVDAAAQWGLLGVTPTPVRVAVIDTGYTDHEDLYGRAFGDRDPGTTAHWGVCNASVYDYPSSWHGTRVASIVNAQMDNAVGMASISGNDSAGRTTPNVITQHYKAIGQCDLGSLSDVVAAINRSVSDAKAVNVRQVINLSLGARAACPSSLQTAISAATTSNMAVVVSAGNDNLDSAGQYPANCQGVVVVAAVSRVGGKTWYSNHGTNVTLAAPGGDGVYGVGANDILTARNASTTSPIPMGGNPYGGVGWYDTVAGTSFAAPMVTATLAAVFSANPNISASDAINQVKANVRPFPQACAGCGVGILDVYLTMRVFQPRSGIGTPGCGSGRCS